MSIIEETKEEVVIEDILKDSQIEHLICGRNKNSTFCGIHFKEMEEGPGENLCVVCVDIFNASRKSGQSGYCPIGGGICTPLTCGITE